jgi:chemotaxis family two-component system sensor kinase Cph1
LLREQFAEQLAGEGAELISMIQDGVNRMGLIIKDLLAFARATPARDRVEEVDMNEVLSKALSDLNEPVAESGAVITHDPLPRVMGNANQLGQVLNNLIGNAIKYRSGEPPRIHVSAVERERDWEFSVRDNGIGIDPAHFERIFAIFQRLHEDGRYAGSGVGLAICKKIVEHHQGRIWLDSQPGRGSTFFFTVPKQTDGPGI